MKQKIRTEDWSDQKGMAKPKKEEFKVLNNYLEQMRSSFVECYREMTIKKQVINVDTFKKAYYGGNESEITLCKLMTYHNQNMKETICWGTLKNYFTTQKYLQKPKSITKQFRILLFPENGAAQYYQLVFGRVLFWMLMFLIATYLYFLAKQFIDSNTSLRYKEIETNQYRKA